MPARPPAQRPARALFPPGRVPAEGGFGGEGDVVCGLVCGVWCVVWLCGCVVVVVVVVGGGVYFGDSGSLELFLFLYIFKRRLRI